MKFYFDVKETFIKTVAVDADSLEIAEQRLKNAYKREEFKIEHDVCDDVEFKEVSEDELLTNEKDEVETLNCSGDVDYIYVGQGVKND